MVFRRFIIGLFIFLSISPAALTAKPAPPVLLPCRPIDAGSTGEDSKYPWLIAVLDRQVRFRIAPLGVIASIDDDRLSAALPTVYDYTAALSDKKFKAAAVNLGATHLLTQKFEILNHTKSLNYYAEIITITNGKTVTGIERDIPLDNISSGIDSCLMMLLEQSGKKLSNTAQRFLSLPVTGSSYRTLKSLGEVFLKESDPSVNRLDIGSDFERLINKDPFMLLANYAAGLLYFNAKEYDKSAKYIKELLDLTPIYSSLYITLAQSYRFSGRFNEALQVAMVCEQARLQTIPYMLEKALALEGLNQSADAFATYQRILMLDGAEPNALLFMARLRNDEKNYAEARKFAEKLLKNDRKNGLGNFEHARSLMGLNNYPEAGKALDAAEQLLPEDPQIQECAGDLAMINRQFEKAYRHYQRSTAVRPQEFELFLKSAAALEANGKKEEALKLLYSVVGRFKSKPRLRRQIGLLEYATGSLDSACRSLTMYLATKADDGFVLQTLGHAYMEKKNYRKAQDYYEKSLSLISDKISIKLRLAEIRLHNKDHEAARKILTEIIKEKPLKDAHRMMGDALVLAKRPHDALAQYKKERELHGDNPAVQEKIADLHYTLKFYAPAKKEYELLSRLDANNAGAWYHLALLALRSGDLKTADQHFSHAVKTGKGTTAIWYEAGTLYRSKKVQDKAITAFRHGLELDAKHELMMRDLADTYLSVGNDTAAASLNVKLFELNGTVYAPRLAQAGHLYHKHGQHIAAAVAYERFLKTGKSDFSVNVGLATIVYKKNDYRRVIALLEKVSGDFARRDTTLLMLSHAYCETKQYTKAVPWLTKLRQLTTAIPLEARLSAIASEHAGDTTTAIAMYARLLSFPPDNNHTQDAYHLGTLYEAKKMISNAINRYEKNLQESPDDLRSYERLGGLYMQRENWQDAKRVLEAAQAFPHVSATAQKMLAQTYTASKDMEKAAELYTVYLGRVKDDLEAWKQLASIYYNRKQFAEAIAPLKKVTSLQPDDFKGWYKLGNCYVETENFTAAIMPIGRARTLDPKSIPAIELSARCYRHQKETSTLTAILREWIAIDPKRYDIKMEIGAILLDEKEIDEATAMLTEAIRFIPSEAKPHLLLARAYEFEANDSMRLVHLKSALKFGPDDWETHMELARYYMAHRLGHDAERHFKKALAINPSYSRAHYDYGTLLIARGEFASANIELRLAVETDSTNALYRSVLAYTECRTANVNTALKLAASALQKDSADTRVLYWAGLTYKQAGRRGQAYDAFNAALAIDNSDADCLEALGDLHMEEVHFKEAAEQYFKSWEKGGYNPNRVYKLGNALLYDRKFVEARDFFETILTKNNGYDDAKYRLVYALCELGDFRRARELIPTFQRDGTPWMQLAQGKIYLTEKNTEAALIAYRIASRLAPEHPEVAAGLGNTYLLKQQFDSAIVYLSTASAADTLNMQAMIDLGTIFEQQGNDAAAAQYYIEVDTKYPSYPDVQFRIAKIKAEQKAHEIAIRYLERGTEYHPDDTNLYFMLGRELALTDNYKEAIEAYKKALKIGKGKPVEAFMHIGNIYYDKLVNNRKAKEYYRKYVKAGGNKPEITERLAGI
ncbi:MAG: tetratricopeptide repeat protein [Chitinispirillaceae bacterium]|nr:tetratricopeptide repeat protein [Chitinispirillaceae bacterium]